MHNPISNMCDKVSSLYERGGIAVDAEIEALDEISLRGTQKVIKCLGVAVAGFASANLILDPNILTVTGAMAFEEGLRAMHQKIGHKLTELAAAD